MVARLPCNTVNDVNGGRAETQKTACSAADAGTATLTFLPSIMAAIGL